MHVPRTSADVFSCERLDWTVSKFINCSVIQFMASLTHLWPLTPSPLTWKLRPFGEAISWLYKGGSGTEGDWGWKWRGRIVNYQHNDHNCVQVQPSILRRSTSKDLRAPTASSTHNLHSWGRKQAYWQDYRQRQGAAANSWPCSQTTKEPTAMGTL